jgi:hypothetical protein
MRGSRATIAAGGLVIAATLGGAVPALAASPTISHEECRDGGGKVTKGEPEATLALVPSADDCKGGRHDGDPVTD